MSTAPERDQEDWKKEALKLANELGSHIMLLKKMEKHSLNAIKRAQHFESALVYIRDKTSSKDFQKKGFDGSQVTGLWRIALTAIAEAPEV